MNASSQQQNTFGEVEVSGNDPFDEYRYYYSVAPCPACTGSDQLPAPRAGSIRRLQHAGAWTYETCTNCKGKGYRIIYNRPPHRVIDFVAGNNCKYCSIPATAALLERDNGEPMPFDERTRCSHRYYEHSKIHVGDHFYMRRQYGMPATCVDQDIYAVGIVKNKYTDSNDELMLEVHYRGMQINEYGHVAGAATMTAPIGLEIFKARVLYLMGSGPDGENDPVPCGHLLARWTNSNMP